MLVQSSVERPHVELPADPWVFGVVALAIFMILLVGLLIFGKGRAHA